MKFIVNTCAGREHFVNEIVAQIPDVIVNYDDFTDKGKFTSTAYFNYQRGWKLAGEFPCVQMDDDIVLTTNFVQKIKDAVAQYPNEVIQFFSMRKDDVKVGTRFEPVSNFLMQQCYYLPSGIAKYLYDFSFKYYETTEHKNCPSDICIQEALKTYKPKYLIWIPNLVDHRVAQSKINKTRSSKRQSKSFQP